MQKIMVLQNWFNQLRRLYPITGVVHVGAGSGFVLARYVEWGVSNGALIEAEESLQSKLELKMQGLPGWKSYCALASDSDDVKSYYLATNPNENGVLQPESLAHLWRNLRTRDRRQLKATTLDALLASTDSDPRNFNWAVIDCLPALPVLKGANALLAACDVIVVRTIFGDDEMAGTGATKAEIDNRLSTHGFSCIAWEEENQPAIAKVIYVRNWRATVSSLESQLACAFAEQAKLVAEGQNRAELLILERDAKVKELATQAVQLEEVTRVKAGLDTAVIELRAQNEQLVQAREEQARLVAESQTWAEQVILERDAKVRELATQAVQLEEVTRVKAGLDTAVIELRAQNEQLVQVSEEQARLVAEGQSRAEQMILESDEKVRELVERQRLLDDELLKAEAQIELIKDVVLREKAF